MGNWAQIISTIFINLVPNERKWASLTPDAPERTKVTRHDHFFRFLRVIQSEVITASKSLRPPGLFFVPETVDDIKAKRNFSLFLFLQSVIFLL